MYYPVVGVALFLATLNIAASNSGTSVNDKEVTKEDASILHQSTTSIPATTPKSSVTTAVPTTPKVVNATTTETTVVSTASTTGPTTARTSESTTTMSTKVTEGTTSTNFNSSSTTMNPYTSPKPTKPSLGPTTKSSVINSTTVSPKGRHFDGISFMGGIILTACIVGLGVGFYKFYKIKNEQSYHTL